MKTKAAIAYAPGMPLEVNEIEIDGPREGEVLVEIKASGICHTDIFALSGQSSTTIFPTVLGHEGAGIVADVGPGVTSLQPGDHVIPLYVPECRQCSNCTSGRTNLCLSIRDTRDRGVMPDGTSRFSTGQTSIHHFMGTSTFSNFTVLPEIALAKIRKDAPFDKVCFLGCGVPTGIGAALYSVNIRPGDNVVVFGLGGIGLNVLQGARMAGANMIIGVDLNPAREQIARRLGLTHFINVKEAGGNIIEHIKDLTHGGADFAFEAVGNVNVMRQALDSCRLGWGTCVVIGLEPSGIEMSVRPVDVRYGKRLIGSYFGGMKGRSQLPQLVDWYMEGKILVDEFIEDVSPVENINSSIDRINQINSIRSVVVF
jgi:S-(hydroxymethyl)glutathione dehydrogenase/alcohol dehydrogenase